MSSAGAACGARPLHSLRRWRVSGHGRRGRGKWCRRRRGVQTSGRRTDMVLTTPCTVWGAGGRHARLRYACAGLPWGQGGPVGPTGAAVFVGLRNGPSTPAPQHPSSALGASSSCVCRSGRNVAWTEFTVYTRCHSNTSLRLFYLHPAWLAADQTTYSYPISTLLSTRSLWAPRYPLQPTPSQPPRLKPIAALSQLPWPKLISTRLSNNRI